MGRHLNTEFTHDRLSLAELRDLRVEYATNKREHWGCDWDFYCRWFGCRPDDAMEHAEMNAIIEREIDVSETVLAGGIPWNLEFAGGPRYLAGSERWGVMLRGAPGSGYSFGVWLHEGFHP